ncbi:MAG TPA: hypothetical protein VMU54_07955 [Planctomycetota bacterium]|nr:hypothetical protein [Planctomycetota bacterium]
MRTTAVLLVLGPLLLQPDPVAAAKRDLGAGFSVERLDAGILLAVQANADADAFRQRLQLSIRSFRSRVLDVSPKNSLLIVLFGDAEGMRSYTARRYSRAGDQSTFYDLANRRLLLRGPEAPAFGVHVARSFFLTDALETPLLPPWIPAALQCLDETEEDGGQTFDHRAALLREALRHGTLPKIREFCSMNAADFAAGENLSLHSSEALKLGEYLEGQKGLRPFFDAYLKSARRDPSGIAALETALGAKADAIEKAFEAHVKGLSWLHKDRFESQARRVFGDQALIQVDDELMLAASGNIEPDLLNRSLEHIRRLREPLIRFLRLRPSGLPILARLFKDEASFQEYAQVDAPHRQWIGGYFAISSRWIVLHLHRESGSLTHEYCHSLFEDDMGLFPPWISEGLASLYEDYHLEGDKPVGNPGLTLRTVKALMAEGKLPSMTSFVNYRAKDFWDPPRAKIHYDIARAFLLYIQDKGALAPAYLEMQKVRKAHPYALPFASWIAALEEALGGKMDKVSADFRGWLASIPD